MSLSEIHQSKFLCVHRKSANGRERKSTRGKMRDGGRGRREKEREGGGGE